VLLLILVNSSQGSYEPEIKKLKEGVFMKKVLSLVVVSVLALSIVACTKKKAEEVAPAAPTPAEAPAAPAAPEAPAQK